MATTTEVNDLIERLMNDAADHEGVNPYSWGLTDYLKTLLEDGNLTHEAAIGSAKRASEEGISSLSDNQIKAIALDMLKNDTYMPACLNEGCSESIAWGDMWTAIWEGQCYHCVNRKEKIARE